MHRSPHDVVIVGARPAGAATALLLARAGARVLVVERAAYGSDTVSTHALMRAGVLQLHRWGLGPALVATGAPPIRRTTFFYGDEAVEVAIRPRLGVDALYAPRRTALDALLVDAARAAGAEVRHGVALVGLSRDAGGRIDAAILEDVAGRRTRAAARLVVGADGLRSTVARLVGARMHHRGRHAAGILYGYFAGVADGGYEWHYRPGVTAGVIPTSGGASRPPRHVIATGQPGASRVSACPDASQKMSSR